MFPLSVLATTADPDSAPTIVNITIDRNLIAAGDWLITGLYNIPYASPPTLHADQTFIIRFMQTDGTTEIGAVAPYAYAGYHYGYGQGCFSIYLSPSVAGGLSWGTSYFIQITENPSQFPTPLKWVTTLSASNYASFTTQADNQADVATQIYTIGSILAPIYNKTFFTTVGTREILTADGEAYFRGAVSGIQSMAPALFVVQQNTVDLTSRTWTNAAFNAYLTRFNGTWVGDIMTQTGDQFGMNGNMVMGMIIIAPLCIGLLIVAGMKFRTTDPGLVGASVILEMGAVMGWVPAAIFAMTFQLMGIYIAYLLFYSRG